MRRRAILGGALAVASFDLSARAQTACNERRLGVLMPFSAGDPRGQVRADALSQGLVEHGWHEGSNLAIDWRWAAADADLFERYAAELVALKPDILVAQSSPSTRALQRHTSTIPIVFAIVTDPVAQHLVKSLSKPGGNITGFSDYDAPMVGKWVEMLTQVTPAASHATVIYNLASATFFDTMIAPIEAAAREYSIALRTSPIDNDADIERAISAHANDRGNGVIVLPDIFTFVHRAAIVAAANRYKQATVYWHRAFVEDGGLMCYGVDNTLIARLSADYVDRILKGARPADLPIQNPAKFELAANLKTAKSLGISFSPVLLAAADEVIE